MPLFKIVHLGGIDLGRERCVTVIKGKRAEVLYELNNWLFDFFYAHCQPIKQLPHLDDWTHSDEDDSHWSVAFPDIEWQVWLKSELIEF
jgi:hypothetical protein